MTFWSQQVLNLIGNIFGLRNYCLNKRASLLSWKAWIATMPHRNICKSSITMKRLYSKQVQRSCQFSLEGKKFLEEPCWGIFLPPFYILHQRKEVSGEAEGYLCRPPHRANWTFCWVIEHRNFSHAQKLDCSFAYVFQLQPPVQICPEEGGERFKGFSSRLPASDRLK